MYVHVVSTGMCEAKYLLSISTEAVEDREIVTVDTTAVTQHGQVGYC